MRRNNFEADWTACDMAADPAYAGAGAAASASRSTRRSRCGWSGYTFPTFWRPATANFRIGDRVEKGLHLIQVWMLRTDGSEEVLVLYPQDGYWRARPMAPPGMRNTSYGSSFLVGPIEVEGRPIVKIKEVAFDPKARRLPSTSRGRQGHPYAGEIDQNRMAIDVTFDKSMGTGPFAMLRSMYVTEFNNDVARIAVREKGAKGWREDDIMTFDRATATDVWAGRLFPRRTTRARPTWCSTASPTAPTRSARRTNRRRRPRRRSRSEAEPTTNLAAKPVTPPLPITARDGERVGVRGSRKALLPVAALHPSPMPLIKGAGAFHTPAGLKR